MQLRILTAADCADVASLEKQLFNSQLDIQSLQSLLSKASFYGVVVSSNNRACAIVAYILAYITEDCAEIISIGTCNYHQRAGYGWKMLNYFISIVTGRNIDKIVLEVASDNIAAISLYQKCGFFEAGRREKYYRRTNGSFDAIIMIRKAGSSFS